jgi:hypothetical protein
VEVDGLVLVSHPHFAVLAEGAPEPVPATAWDGVRAAPIAVTAADLVPTPYLGAIAADLARVGGAESPGSLITERS